MKNPPTLINGDLIHLDTFHALRDVIGADAAHRVACEARPTIRMDHFFAIPAVKAAQEVQKHNPYGSAAHRAAHDAIIDRAKWFHAESYFGQY